MKIKYSNICSIIFISSLMLGISANISAEEDFYALDFEALMKVKITSVAKRAQSLEKTAAAVYVISQTDIQQSSMSTLAELLRGVPGLFVAQIDANKWAVSIRGMADRFTNNLLVLVDGRSVYTPIFGGVYWNMQDMPLANIKQIEVVRGTGGTLWGANAVNGVINVITKHSEDTLGWRLSLAGGSQGELLSARYGEKLSEHSSYRIFAKANQIDDYYDSLAFPAHDEWDNIDIGLRFDSQQTENQQWLIEGGLTKGKANQTTGGTSLTPPETLVVQDQIDYNNSHLLLRLNQQNTDNSDFQFQAYLDYFERTANNTTHTVMTYDLDFHQRFNLNSDTQLIWGAGYRGVDDDLETRFTVSFTPEKKYVQIYNAFVQGEFQLSDSMRFTLGTKFEHNDFSGFEYQPSARFLWTLTSEHHFWASISRGVHTPTRSDQDIRINYLVLPADPADGAFAPNTLFSIQGNPELQSEIVESTEMGYRGTLNSSLMIDLSIFYNDFQNLKSKTTMVSFEEEPQPTHLLITSIFDNDMRAHTYGFEGVIKWQLNQQWRVSANYSWLDINAHYKAGSLASVVNLIAFENADPEKQASIHSLWQAKANITLTTAIYYVNAISTYDVEAYTRIDLGLHWQVKPHIKLSLIGANLLDRKHKEYETTDAFYTQIPRSFSVQMVVKY